MNSPQSSAVKNVAASHTFEKRQPQQHHYPGYEIERLTHEGIGVFEGRIGYDAANVYRDAIETKEVEAVPGAVASVVDEVGRHDGMASVPENTNDGSWTAGWLPKQMRELLDGEQRGNSDVRGLIEVISALAKRRSPALR